MERLERYSESEKMVVKNNRKKTKTINAARLYVKKQPRIPMKIKKYFRFERFEVAQ